MGEDEGQVSHFPKDFFINNALASIEDKGIIFSTFNFQLSTQPLIAASINGGITNAPL